MKKAGLVLSLVMAGCPDSIGSKKTGQSGIPGAFYEIRDTI